MAKRIKGQKVLITGGAAGIGLCTAEYFAKAGAELILTDINQAGLDAAKDKLAKYKVPVHTRVVDVSNRQQVEEMAAWVINDLGHLDILVNNAGIGLNKQLVDTTIEDWQRQVSINFFGPLHHVYAFLPHMIKKGKGHIVNVSSGQAFFRLPTWAAYASIKLALGAFSEVLGVEIRKHNIKVTTVYPFMVNTGFYDGVEGETWAAKMSMKLLPYYSMTPDKVGKIIFNAVRKEKRVEMVSLFNDVGYYSRLIPPVSNIISGVSNLILAPTAK